MGSGGTANEQLHLTQASYTFQDTGEPKPRIYGRHVAGGEVRTDQSILQEAPLVRPATAMAILWHRRSHKVCVLPPVVLLPLRGI